MAHKTWPDQREELIEQGLPEFSVFMAMRHDASLDMRDEVLRFYISLPSCPESLVRLWDHRKKNVCNDGEMLVGCSDEGCYNYYRFCNRPAHTQFLPWDSVESIYIHQYADDDHQSVSLNGMTHSGRHESIQGQNRSMEGFESFVRIVSNKFFQDDNYIFDQFAENLECEDNNPIWEREDAKQERIAWEKDNEGWMDKETPMRNVCTHCGAWREIDDRLMTQSLMEGYDPESEEGEKVAEARKVVGPFHAKHLKSCGPDGGMILGIYQNTPEWDELDPAKQEK